MNSPLRGFAGFEPGTTRYTLIPTPSCEEATSPSLRGLRGQGQRDNHANKVPSNYAVDQRACKGSLQPIRMGTKGL